jgi:hypothetical protein
MEELCVLENPSWRVGLQPRQTEQLTGHSCTHKSKTHTNHIIRLT